MNETDNGTEKWRVIMDGLKYIVDVTFKIVGVVLLIVTVITQPIIMYINLRNGAKIDTAATAAESAAKVAVETKQDQGEKLTAIATKADVLVVSADANIKSLKAWKSGQPEDQNAAAKAVVNAERLTENMPPVTPKP